MNTRWSKRASLARLALAMALALDPGRSAIGAEPLTAGRVLAEYPKALAALEARSDRCRGEGILSFTEQKGDGVPEPFRSFVRFRFSGGDALLTTSEKVAEIVGPPGPSKPEELARRYPQTTLFYNDRYGAIVSQDAASSTYRIDRLEATAGSSAGRSLASLMQDKGGHLVRCTTTVGVTPISRLMKRPDLRIDKVAEVQGEGPRRWRIDFSFSNQVIPPEAFSRPVSGWLVVTPELGWILHEYSRLAVTKGGDQITSTGRVDYRPGPSGIPEPTRVSRSEYRGKPDADPAAAGPAVVPMFREEIRFTKLEFGETPARDFTLAAFGLPGFAQASRQLAELTAEQPAPAPAPVVDQPAPRPATMTPTWWIPGLAVVALALAFFGRRLGSKPAPSGRA